MNIQALLYHPGSRTSCGRSVGRKENNPMILNLLTTSTQTHGICYLPLELENKIQHTFLSFLQPFFHASFTPIYTTFTVAEPIVRVVAARARPENHTLTLDVLPDSKHYFPLLGLGPLHKSRSYRHNQKVNSLKTMTV